MEDICSRYAPGLGPDGFSPRSSRGSENPSPADSSDGVEASERPGAGAARRAKPQLVSDFLLSVRRASTEKDERRVSVEDGATAPREGGRGSRNTWSAASAPSLLAGAGDAGALKRSRTLETRCSSEHQPSAASVPEDEEEAPRRCAETAALGGPRRRPSPQLPAVGPPDDGAEDAPAARARAPDAGTDMSPLRGPRWCKQRSMISTASAEHSSTEGRRTALLKGASAMSIQTCDGRIFEVLEELKSSQPRVVNSQPIIGLLAGSRLGSTRNGETVGEGLWERSMVSPSSKKTIAREALGSLLLVHDFVMVPFHVFGPLLGAWETAMSWIARLFWTLDVPASFFAGYFKVQGSPEMRPGVVARRYARTWLAFDLLCLALDWTNCLGGGRLPVAHGFHLGHLGRFLRVARIARAVQSAKLWTDRLVRSEEVRLVGSILWSVVLMLGMAHFVACAWYANAAVGAEASWLRENGLRDATVMDHYAFALHWSLAQYPGEMILAPEGSSQRMFALVVVFLFFVAAAMFVSRITTSMTRLHILSSHQSKQFAELHRFLIDHRISRELAMRVHRNAEHALAMQKRNAPDSSIELFQMVSLDLQVDVHYEVHSPVLLQHPFFRNFMEVNSAAVRMICHTGASNFIQSPGDIVFSNGETPVLPRMLFVVEGSLYYTRQRERKDVKEGQWLCEAVLWTRWTHCGTLMARSDCRMLSITAQAFHKACEKFPSLHPGEYADQFVHHLNEYLDDLTDMRLSDAQVESMLEAAFPEWQDAASPEALRPDSPGSQASPLAGQQPSGPGWGAFARAAAGGPGRAGAGRRPRRGSQLSLGSCSQKSLQSLSSSGSVRSLRSATRLPPPPPSPPSAPAEAGGAEFSAIACGAPPQPLPLASDLGLCAPGEPGAGEFAGLRLALPHQCGAEAAAPPGP
ncbi:unnamed protein product [Prorocentrum cordatum]|uniref:Cyclic nucleotide-binding domain-containing protein n=1 Tax=Prorocentrum cordatum TaxID=2364126 RepID=A0ABN9UAA7_9DINO|nr:unnamed protein product [Polarella glacialis]